MYNKLTKKIKSIKVLRDSISTLRRYIYMPYEKKYIEMNKKLYMPRDSDSEILVEFCRYSHCVVSWSVYANILAKKYNARIVSYSYPEKYKDYVYHSLFSSFGTQKHNYICLSGDLLKKKDEIVSEILSRVKTKEDWFNIECCGYIIGQEIYEEYLMHNHATLEINDPEARTYLDCAVTGLLYWIDYFSTHSVKTVIISHDCYILSIIRKVANNFNVPVYQITNLWAIRLNPGYNCGSEFKYYPQLFLQLSKDDQIKGIEWAKERLQRRIKGEVGIDMSYSLKSSFSEHFTHRRILAINGKIKILICTHCFFDQPHAYGKMFFLDFYEWLCFLGDMSEQTDYDWYLKVHPDYRPGTLEKIHAIVTMYPKIKVIPPEISHNQLAKEGIDFVFTCHGTVGCEYPLLGVNVINAHNNPHIAYDFNYHPNSKEEYENMIFNLPSLRCEVDTDKVYEFYCVHHLHSLYYSERRSTRGVFYSNDQAINPIREFINSNRIEDMPTIVKQVEEYLVRVDNHKVDKLF